ncbi:MAG: RNA polymerase sigma factor [Bdellovibrionaceae bacterium]|nr:RNA polymerase sigma factor [Pseudobdellovibrionaceae bacterium]NUM59212.1 RNA polymerase sigma factor [Pseudobdellovibrionaceae bacterium]
MDKLEWNLLIEKMGDRLYNYFLRRGHYQSAGDLTQETYVRLWVYWKEGRVDAAKGSLESLAFGIAYYVSLERVKELKSIMQEDPDWDKMASSENIEEMYQKKELHFQFHLALKQLPEEQQDILTLYMDETLKLEEIAKILEIPLGTIKNQIYRAKEKMKLIFEAKGVSL